MGFKALGHNAVEGVVRGLGLPGLGVGGGRIASGLNNVQCSVCCCTVNPFAHSEIAAHSPFSNRRGERSREMEEVLS